MKASDFREWLGRISQLSRDQKEQVRHCLSEVTPQAVVVKLLENSFESSCPACQADRFYRWGHQVGLWHFQCCAWKHTFTAVLVTSLTCLRHKEKWLNYSAALIEGLIVRANARRCRINKNTSIRWPHRFLALPAATKANHLQGIVDADETFFPSSYKGQRHLSRPPRTRSKQIHARGTSKDQVPVLVVRDRSGATADFMLTAIDKKTIESPLQAILAKEAIFCSDSAAVYRSVAHGLGIAHRPVNLFASIRGIAGIYPIQNVNAYDSRLKQWMKGFHGVVTKYLGNYLGRRRWLERWGKHNSSIIGLRAAFGRENRFQQLTRT